MGKTDGQFREATRWTTVFAVVAAGVTAALQVGKGAIATPIMQADLDLDLATISWLTSIFAVLGLAGGIPAGALVAGWGDRRMLITGLLAIVIGAASGALSSSFTVLLGSRIIEGFGFLFITVAGPGILQRVVTEEHRNRAFALWSCFMPGGMAIALLFGPLFASWQSIWWASAILAGATILVSLATIPSPRLGPLLSWSRVAADAAATITARGPVLLAVCFAIYSLMFFALFSFLPVLLMERMHVSLTTAGLLSALAIASNIIGNLAAGFFLSMETPRWLLIAGASIIMGLCSLAIFLGVLTNSLTFLLCIVFCGIGGLIPATLLSTAPIVAGRATLTPVVVGLLMQGSNFGQVIGPVGIGTAIQNFGWPTAAMIVGAGAILAVIAALFLRATLNRVER